MQMGLPATILGRPAPSSLEMILMGTGLWVGEFLVSAKEGSTPGLADLAREGMGSREHVCIITCLALSM